MDGTVRKTSMLSICVVTEIVIASLIAVFTAIQKSEVVSLLFAASFIVLFIFIILSREGTTISRTVILLVLICTIHVIANCWLSGGSISYSYLKKLIMFLSFATFLDFSTKNDSGFTGKAINIIKFSPLLAGVFLIFSYYIMGNTKRIAGSITLGFPNPNFTGMWLLHFFLYGCLFVIEGISVDRKRWLFLPILIFLFRLIVETQARSVYIAIASFFLLLNLGARKTSMNRLGVLAISVFPLIYLVVYLKIIDETWISSIFDFLVSTGKTLTSRKDIWAIALSHFKNSPIIGDYYGISGGLGQSQLHNTHLDVLCSYGLFPLVLLIKLLYNKLCMANLYTKSYYQYAALCAFCSIVVQGSFEAAVVAGSTGLNLLTVGLLVIAIKEPKKEPLEKE